MSELHLAARAGSTERTIAVLSRGVTDIDQGTSPDGVTPLMVAASLGYSRIVGILLNKGATVAIMNGDGFTALHCSAQQGHLTVTNLLVKAGADLEAATYTLGCTPLHLAAEQGHAEMMGVLIEAGTNPNIQRLDGGTPLHAAAQAGHMYATKVLLRAKANPLLTFSSPCGAGFVPLDIAAENGQLKVVDELIQELGMEGCGGVSGGVNALAGAAKNQHVEIMGMLTSAGVVDTGVALTTAARSGRESSVKFLLLQWERTTSGQGTDYLEYRDPSSMTALLWSVHQACLSCSPRITRLLVDAGANTTTTVRLADGEGRVFFDDTPLIFGADLFRGKNVDGKDATEKEIHNLKATRRLLMRVEAIHAVSWLWASDAPSVAHAATEPKSKTKTTPTPLMLMLPVLRRRALRPRVLLAALFKNYVKP